MRVHLIKKQTIRDYLERNSLRRNTFIDFLTKIRGADWENPNDIRATFSNANVDILGGGSKRVIFDVGGNNYRIICTYYFGENNLHLYINWIGTHAEYDKLCKSNKQYTINDY